jgi:hypothetical protein
MDESIVSSRLRISPKGPTESSAIPQGQQLLITNCRGDSGRSKENHELRANHSYGTNKKGDLEVALSSEIVAVLPYSDASSVILRQI